MAQRHYSSNARETTITGSVSSSDVTIQVDNPVGYPVSTPFIIHVELGTSNEEIMLVTGVAGNTWTVTRGYDSSTALPHEPGAKVVHGVSAIDFEDAASHINATSNVHGVTGTLVSTTASQTLTNKTLTDPVINGGTIDGASITGLDLTSPSFSGGGSWTGSPAISSPAITGGGSWAGSPTLITPTIASFINAQHSHTDAASGGLISGGGGSDPGGGGSSGGFPTGSYNNESGSGSFSSTSNSQIGSMQFTLTTPSEWPSWASKIQYHAQISLGSNTSADAHVALMFQVDGFLLNDYSFNVTPNASVLQLSQMDDLPPAGESFSVRLYARLYSGSPAVNYFSRSMWATLI